MREKNIRALCKGGIMRWKFPTQLMLSLFLLIFPFTIVSAIPPDDPSYATLVDVTDTSMVFKWQNNACDTCYDGFYVERDTTTGGTGFVLIGTIAHGIYEYSGPGMSDLRPNKKARYRVCCYNDDGNSGYATDSMWTTPGYSKDAVTYYGGKDDGYSKRCLYMCSLPPLDIARATLVDVTDTSVVFKWEDKCCGEDSFAIYRDTTVAAAGYVRIAQLGPNSFPVIMSYSGPETNDLLPNKKCRYRVYVYRGATDSAYVTDSIWTRPAESKDAVTYYGGKDDGYTGYDLYGWPLPPLQIEKATLVDVTDSSVVFKWQDRSGDEDSFAVYRDTTAAAAGYVRIAQMGAGSGIMSYSGAETNDLLANKKCRYRAYVYRGATDNAYVTDSIWTKPGESKDVVTYYGGKDDGYAMVTLSEIPVGIVLMSFDAQPMSNYVQLRWEIGVEIDMAKYFVMRRSETSETYDLIAEVPVDGSQSYAYKDNELEPGHLYWYKLGLVSLNSKITWFGPLAVKYVGTGIPKSIYLTVIPTVGKNSFYIKYGVPKSGSILNKFPVNLEMFDVSGRRVRVLFKDNLRCGYYSKRLDFSDFPSGVYFLRLRAGDKYLVRKSIILR